MPSQAKKYVMSFIPQSIKNMVSGWSTKKQIAVATTTVGFLALAAYNKDTLIQLLSNAYDNAPDLGVTARSTTLYSQLPTHAQTALSLVGKHVSKNPKITGAAIAGVGVLAAKKVDSLNRRERVRKTGISEFYVEPKKNLQQQHETRKAMEAEQLRKKSQNVYLSRIVNDNIFGEEYAIKANAICSADYTEAEKLGKVNLCVSLKKNPVNLSISVSKDSRFFIAQEPTEEDIKMSIDRQYKVLQRYKKLGWAQ